MLILLPVNRNVFVNIGELRMALTFVLNRSNIWRYVLDMSDLIKVFCPFFWWPNAGTQEKCLFRNIIIIIYHHQYYYYCYLLSSILLLLLLLSLFWGIPLLAVLAQNFGGFSILKNTQTVFTYHPKFAPPMLHAWRLFYLFAGTLLHTLEEHIGVVRCLCLLGNRLVSGGDQKRIAVWDVKVCETSN